MGLDEIAGSAGTTTIHQRSEGVAAVDRTDIALADRLEPVAASLPCDAPAAATILQTHVTGTPIGESARQSGVSPITAAKTLHKLGMKGIAPIGPTGRTVVQDWIAGGLTRSEAIELTGLSQAMFALAAYIETHDPVPEAATIRAALEERPDNAMVTKRDQLAGTLDGVE